MISSRPRSRVAAGVPVEAWGAGPASIPRLTRKLWPSCEQASRPASTACSCSMRTSSAHTAAACSGLIAVPSNNQPPGISVA